jgi:PcRGLX-like protein C-terminal alpha/alpha toroid domain/PcRGLX-like protein central beta sandwich domain/PcRGLX-like N-terminal RIFT barrel domain
MNLNMTISRLQFLTADEFHAHTGVAASFPVKKGVLKKRQAVSLKNMGGKELPAQFWPLAYWPDGSIKWMGVATVLDRVSIRKTFRVTRQVPALIRNGMTVTRGRSTITVNTGTMRCRIPLKGKGIIDQLSIRKGRRWIQKVAENHPAVLFVSRAHLSRVGNVQTTTSERFLGETQMVALEQDGPIRTVVKIDGIHKSGREKFLPFSIRLYFHKGCNTIKVVHTFFYDGDSKKDFIARLGIDFPIIIKDTPCNRHVFMGLNDQLWHEPVNILPSVMPAQRGCGLKPNPDYARQLAFEYLPNAKCVHVTPVWNEYSLFQDSCDHFSIEKTTSDECAAVLARHGTRSSGWGGIIAPQGGVAVGIRDFWQAYPSAITLRNAGANDVPVVLSAELWPSRSEPLDLRHYSTKAYAANYESVGKYKLAGVARPWIAGSPLSPFTGDPYGIGRTSEMTFHILDGDEEKGVLECQSRQTANPPTLVCPPKTYATAKVFSPICVPSNKKLLRPIEKKLTEILNSMVSQTEKYRWYGFIDYGDLQIQYDNVRRDWKYDEGGVAWINEELMPGIFLWRSFLRTGRLDVFRAAEAMSRHAEVDMFHIGPLTGIGTRHNVKHWGCSNHEIRQSMAGLKRYYHLVTGDERTRDIILNECPQVGNAWVANQKARSKTGKRSLRNNEVTGTLGPHLSSFFWNWLATWEFTGSPKHRSMVLNGLDYMAKQNQPYGLAGNSMAYKINFETGQLTLLPPNTKPSMSNIFGSTEIWLEFEQLLDSKDWSDTLTKYASLHLIDSYVERFAVAPDAIGQGAGIEDSKLAFGGIDLVAFFGARKRNDKVMKRAVWKLLKGQAGQVIASGTKDNRRFASWGNQAISVIALLERYVK